MCTAPFTPLELVARVKSQLRRYTKLGNAAEESQKVYQTGGLVMNDDPSLGIMISMIRS